MHQHAAEHEQFTLIEQATAQSITATTAAATGTAPASLTAVAAPAGRVPDKAAIDESATATAPLSAATTPAAGTTDAALAALGDIFNDFDVYQGQAAAVENAAPQALAAIETRTAVAALSATGARATGVGAMQQFGLATGRACTTVIPRPARIADSAKPTVYPVVTDTDIHQSQLAGIVYAATFGTTTGFARGAVGAADPAAAEGEAPNHRHDTGFHRQRPARRGTGVDDGLVRPGTDQVHVLFE
ncbi:MAG: hypothetical protein KDH88_00670 [Chromatiales bacterium]|nr:hypothetical protein [Chromatiales bacterium]